VRFIEHCARSQATFGNPHENVHLWLDEFAGKPPHGMRHRRFRHHEAGIQEVQQMWGTEAAQAARQHIEDDLSQEGWKPSDPFPKNEKDYVRLGFF